MGVPSPVKRLPDSELEVMLIIWEGGDQVSTSHIMQQLDKQKKVQMIQSYLNRLEQKSFVRCEKIGRLNHYTPLISMEEYRGSETDTLIQRLYRNSPAKLFATLIQNNTIPPEEFESIRKLLEGSED